MKMPPTENTSVASLDSELPELVEKIEANWPILPSGMWNSSSVHKLSRHLHEFSLRTQSAAAKELHELILDIDSAINEIIDENAPPDDQQIDQLNRFLTQLHTLVGSQRPAPQVTTPTPTLDEDTPPYDLIYLAASETEAKAFHQALEAQSLQGHVLLAADKLSFTIANPGTKTLLVDASFLGTQALEPVLHLLQINKSTAPALFVIADESTVETRLTAMRAGAAHLFTRPVEANRLIETLHSHLHPVTKPRPRVLVVEDDESQANFAIKLLRKRELDALAITDPLGVIDTVSRFQPDLILMDLYMPGADGIELTRVIRDRWESSAIPVVFVSGEDDPEKKLLALMAGADDFLTKPVRPQQLLATVDTRIKRARQIAAVAAQQATESTRIISRRELLSQLDLTLGLDEDGGKFRALLVICLAGTTPIGSAERQAPVDPLISEAILQHLREDDQLAALDANRLALLYQRDDEKALEQLAEQLYQTLATNPLGEESNGRFGIGMMLLNGVDRNAYEQLSRIESFAESACRQGVTGFALYGETPAETAASADATPADQNTLLHALRDDTIAFRRQHYTCRHPQSPETIELLPIPSPATNQEEPFRLAAASHLETAFDRYVFDHALQVLGERVARGRAGRLIFQQSSSVVSEADSLEFIKSELRRHQIVGTGLMVEFDLPSLAANLKSAKSFIGELAAMGIAVALGNFACNETAYKVLAYLRADAVRPHYSLLRLDAERIQHIAQQVQSLQAEIILPRVIRHGQIAHAWKDFVDCVQADFTD